MVVMGREGKWLYLQLNVTSVKIVYLLELFAQLSSSRKSVASLHRGVFKSE